MIIIAVCTRMKFDPMEVAGKGFVHISAYRNRVSGPTISSFISHVIPRTITVQPGHRERNEKDARERFQTRVKIL